VRPHEQAEELVDQLIKGNRTHVRVTLGSLPASRAAAVAWYMYDRLEGDAYLVGVVGRLLTDHLPSEGGEA